MLVAAAMTLVVDESQIARRITTVHERITAHAGTFDLAYPKWIPGEHGPVGPIQQVAALRVRAGAQTLRWRRDADDIYTIRVDVPAGASTLDVDFDALLVNAISDDQLLLAWSTSVLYPRGAAKDQLTVTPSVVLPPSWQGGTSLHVAVQTGTRTDYAPVTLERLVDSPVLAGRFYRSVPLASQWPAELDVTGDDAASVGDGANARAFGLFAKLVDQDRALFGYRHFERLHILVSQSDEAPYDGLEHEDDPWNAIPAGGLANKDVLEMLGWPLLAHEQSHSWNGKYRRPGELVSAPDFQGPERTSLLWVYEGLNQYLGGLLATRAGFNDAAYMRDEIADLAASYSAEAARATTPLVDTADEAWVLRGARGGWSSLRRSQDYYGEGMLAWLGADAIIRRETRGRRSLDDFARAFFGQRDTGPIVVPYAREDVERALHAIAPYDWHGYFQSRIYDVDPRPPVDGIEAAGWRLVYDATPTRAKRRVARIDAAYSLGLVAARDGAVVDVTPNGPADAAGIAPQMTIVGVDGRTFTPDVLTAAIAHPPDGVVTLVVRSFGAIETHALRYAGGVRIPHLERIAGTPDLLTAMLRAKPVAKD